MFAKFGTEFANLSIVFHLLEAVAKYRQNFINIEAKMGATLAEQ